MPHVLEAELLSAADAAAKLQTSVAPNGLRYAILSASADASKAGEKHLGHADAPHTSLESIARLVQTVPSALAAALANTTYAFVPLALSGARLQGNDAADAAFQEGDPTLIAERATAELTDRAICHRNAEIDGVDYVFLSALLHNDSFALAFEFFINVAHDLVDIAGMPSSFGELLDEQVAAGVRGETSMDAFEHRAAAFGTPPEEGLTRPSPRQRSAAPAAPLTAEDKQRARRDYHHAAFADAVAVYLLAVFLDFDYADLREREYPLLAPPALAARLRAVHALYPPNDGYEFQVMYRRRG